MLSLLEKVRQRVVDGDWRNHFVTKPEEWDEPGPGCLLQLFAQEGPDRPGACGVLLNDSELNFSIIAWNDAPERTAQDVLDLLDRCIARQILGQD